MFNRTIPARALLLAGALITIAPMAHAQNVKQLQQEINALTATVTTQGQQITSLQGSVTTLQGQVSSLTTQLNAAKSVTNFFSVSGSDLIFTGNLHIVNGTSNSYHANGLGNLFLGYASTSTVTGSHDLIAGMNNTVSGCESFVSGNQNLSAGLDEVVIGGYKNSVYGDYGFSIEAQQSVELPNWGGLVGGQKNQISDAGIFGVAVGGSLNVVECPNGGTLAGVSNTVGGFGWNAIVGGDTDLVDGDNTQASVICGGQQNHLDNLESFIGGGISDHNSGQAAAMIGGNGNVLGSGGFCSAMSAGINGSLNSDFFGSVAASVFNP